jgi:uncharacterized protein (TIGR04255 family)
MARLKLLRPRERCIYAKNPLAEVIAAVKFPRQLTIEEQLPVEFQKLLKTKYPLLELMNVPQFALSAEGATPRSFSLSKAFDFVTEDRKQRVSLTPDLLALTTTAYSRWEHFISGFNELIAAFASIYGPMLFTRVGLRYKDIIDKKAIGIDKEIPWDRLIASDLVRPFTFFAQDMRENPQFTASMNLDLDSAKLTLNYGFVEGNDKETAFIIDTDCYVDPSKIRTTDEVASTFEELHKYTSLAFSAAISDELHSALQPAPP